MDHDHHHHGHHDHHMDAVTTVMPNLTTMMANALMNTSAHMMAMATGDMHDSHTGHQHDHHDMSGHDEHNGHHNNTESGHDGHGDNGDHVGHGGDGGHMMMAMTFEASTHATILFKEWNVTTVGGMIGSVVGIFIMALLYEGLKFMREYLYREYFNAINYSSVAVMGNDGRTKTELHKITKNRIFGWPHLLQTSLHMVQVLVSYFLMLIFMTYNVWLCLAVLLGSGVGYFFFGWKKATVVDISEHCH